MPVSETDLAPVKTSCEGLAVAGDNIFKWEWDGRFGAALSTFQGAQESDVRALLTSSLPVCHDVTTIKDAQKLPQEIAKAFGGLRAGQRLLLSSEDQTPMLVGAWWPWGNGSTISLRVKLVVLGLSGEEKDELLNSFRGWFKL